MSFSTTEPKAGALKQPVRFVPIGDSYTIGHGAKSGQSWPEVLVRNLQQEQVAITLVTNPARSGWTSRMAIDQELPAFEKAKPTFATLLIGANDIARGVDSATFRSNFTYLLDKMQAVVPQPNRLLLLTIPDFSATPAAKRYGGHVDVGPLLRSFNHVIIEQAQKRNLPVVDLYAVSQQMSAEPIYYSSDGLHPSARGYAEWEKVIRPVVRQMLQPE